MRGLLDLVSAINLGLDLPKIFLCFLREVKRGIIHCPASLPVSESLGREGRGKNLPHVFFAHRSLRISMVIGFY